MVSTTMRSATIVIVAAALVLGGQTVAYATYPGRNGAIAYPFGGHDLFVITPAGMKAHSIYHNVSEQPGAPSWSPDGRRLAFAMGGWIYVMRSDGTRFLPRTVGGLPSFAPNGKTLVYTLNYDIWKQAPGGSPTQLTFTGHADKAQWSPSRASIAFVDEVANEIYVMGTDGLNVTCVTCADPLGSVGDPTWAPGSGRIGYSANDDLYVIRVDGSGFRQLTDTPNRHEIECSWSPNGRQIACSASGFGVALEIVTVKDGSRRLIGRTQPGELRQPSWQPIP
jgi:Tol biopolymer transport system component